MESDSAAAMSPLKRPRWFRPTGFPPWYKRLSSTFRHFFKSQFLTDVVIYCKDQGTIEVHKTILCLASPYFRSLVEQIECNEDSQIHVSLPDFSKDHVSSFIEALYRGSVPTEEHAYLSCQYLSDLFGLFSYEDEQSFFSSRLESTEIAPSLPPEDYRSASSEDGSSSISDNDDTQFNVARVDDKEVLFIHRPDEIIDDSFPGDDQVNEIESEQEKLCSSCGREALQHRIEIRTEADKRRLGIPLVPSNESLTFLYRCCVPGCPLQTIRHLKHARAFNAHAERHAMSSVSKVPKMCPLCLKSRLSHRNEGLKQQTPKSKVNRYKCCRCSASKMSAKRFSEHTQNHITKKFVCQTCHKGYSQKKFLDHHVYVEHGEGKGQRFHCNYENCNFEAKYAQTLACHIKEKHEGEKRSHRGEKSRAEVTCVACGKTYKAWYYQQYHRSTCTSSVVYKCQICGQDGFVNSTTLQNHIKAKHSNDKPYVCEYCPAHYATSMSLYGHRARVHQVNKAGEHVPKKLFPCGHCGRLLSDKTKLQSHIRTIHEGSKDFECKFCSKKFTTNSNLKIHEASLHTGDLPHKCLVCHKGFTRKRALEHHMTSHGPQNEEHFVVVQETTSSSHIVSSYSTISDIIL